MKNSLKKAGKTCWNFIKWSGKVIITFIIIGSLINGIGSLLTKRSDKKQKEYQNNKTSVTSIDSTNNYQKGNEVETAQAQKSENKSSVNKDLDRKQELEKKYSYVSGPIVRNQKKYWKVRVQGISSYGLVDYDTNIEVIKPGVYDYIGEEIDINGITYVQVSTPHDDGCAYGLLNFENFTEVIPCGVYRDVDIDVYEEQVECLQKDRTTIDLYEPNENTKVLTKVNK